MLYFLVNTIMYLHLHNFEHEVIGGCIIIESNFEQLYCCNYF